MAKRILLIFVLALAFLCLVSCSSLLEGFIDTSVTDSTTTTLADAATTTPLQGNATTVAPVTTTLPQNNIKIVIDAGHGENDPGALGMLDGAEHWEKGINLSVALKLKEILFSRGYNVVMIRDGDYSLLHGWDTQAEAVARRQLGTSIGADLYLSLHCNSYSGEGRAWGPIVFYNGKGKYSPAKMLNVLKASINEKLSNFDGMRECRSVNDEDYIVLKDRNMPSFLVEMGFLTDESDLSMLIDESWQDAMAQALADAVDTFYEKEYIR